MKKYCYFNGKIIEENKAKLSLDDIGVLRAYACFDFLRTHNGKPFLFDNHWKRFQKSANILNLKIPISKQKVKAIIQKLLTKNKFKESNIRIVLTGGKIKNGMDYDKSKPNFYILITKVHKSPKSFYEKGVKLITYEYQRENFEAKTINYITGIKLNKLLKRQKANDVLYTINKKILETSTGNFFIINDNKLITAKTNVLMGTTRNLLIRLAKKEFKIEERDVLLTELKSADEALITSTTRGIMPVVKIDEQKVGNGKVGEKTKYLIKSFEEYTKNIDKY
jgi:branched-subunit amino acid aminotransferase/4-amino-4-deoxychorismate lyase